MNIRRKKAILDKDRRRILTEYIAEGSLFFGSARLFQNQFDPLTDGNDIVLNLDRSRTVDISALDALNELALRYTRLGTCALFDFTNIGRKTITHCEVQEEDREDDCSFEERLPLHPPCSGV